ncbi:hypothetical protein [Nocardia sp. NPDC047038]|uniref:hypothetical protein n=1 Tax=Nocardia sp. NPDC047038 TaxID=3154338 RepID=UPI0033FDF9AD
MAGLYERSGWHSMTEIGGRAMGWSSDINTTAGGAAMEAVLRRPMLMIVLANVGLIFDGPHTSTRTVGGRLCRLRQHTCKNFDADTIREMSRTDPKRRTA